MMSSRRARRLGVVVVAVATVGVGACTTAGAPAPALLGATPTLNTPTPSAAASSAAPAPAAVALLTGLPGSTGTAVVVPVQPTAGHPPVGLGSADIVAVDFAEHGAFRLVGAFASKPSGKVGPLTMVRPSDAKLFSQINPIFAETGSPSGFLDTVKSAHLPVDAAASNRSGFVRSGSAYYVSTSGVAGRNSLRVSAPMFTYASDGAPLASPAAKTVKTLSVAAPGHATTTWHYDSAAMLWRTAQFGGATATNVVVLSVPYMTKDVSALKASLTWANPLGRGDARIAAGNRSVAGVWSKFGFGSALNLLTSDQQLPAFAPGRTWILLAPPHSTVTAA